MGPPRSTRSVSDAVGLQRVQVVSDTVEKFGENSGAAISPGSRLTMRPVKALPVSTMATPSPATAAPGSGGAVPRSPPRCFPGRR